MKVKDEIFRQYDIRGIVGKDLDEEVAFQIGRGFSAYLRKINPAASQVSVGRDVRLSSGALAQGVIEGILSSGIEVHDIGVCPTPLQYFSIYHLDLDGGIMITGSHNPPEYNGFKLSVGKETIHGDAIQEIKNIIKAGEDIGRDTPQHVGKTAAKVGQYDIIAAYRAYMLREFSYLADSSFNTLKVVVDAGNGTGGLVAPSLFGSIGCDVIPLYCEPDGNFPNHHPDPTVVEYIQDLIETTKQSGADFGVGYDGDSDRIGLVDSDGSVIWGDQLMILLSRDLLKKNPGAKIIGDVKCSQIMFDDIKKHGGTPVMWKTGHSLIKQKMRDENALLAGEFSGHIFIAERYFGFDDAIYTTLRLIEILKRTGKSIRTLMADIPKMVYTPEIRVDCPEEIKKQAVEQVVRKFQEYKTRGGSPHPIKDINTIDGVRVVFEKGWGLVRVSNTQPVIVMRFEALDQKSLDSYRRFMEEEVEAARTAANT